MWGGCASAFMRCCFASNYESVVIEPQVGCVKRRGQNDQDRAAGWSGCGLATFAKIP